MRLEALDSETFLTNGGYVHSTLNEVLYLCDMRCASNKIGNSLFSRTQYFIALLKRHHAEWQLFIDAQPDHDLVPFLENMQAHGHTRKQHRVQGE